MSTAIIRRFSSFALCFLRAGRSGAESSKCATVVDMVGGWLFGWFRSLQESSQITIMLALLGFVGVLGAAIITGFFGLRAPTPSGSNLELVDVSILKESQRATTLDVKVRNTGGQVAFLKEADFEVQRVWELRSAVFAERVRSTYSYDVMLSPKGAPYNRTEKLAQRIDPNGVDRFTLDLALDPRAKLDTETGTIEYVFLIDMNLTYNEDNEVVSSEKVLLVQPLPYENEAYSFRTVRAHNQEVAEEVDSTEGIKSENVERVIRYLSR
jgi:hypothetical protein